MLRIFSVFFLLIFSFCSNAKRALITGEWKPTKVTFTDALTQKATVLFDITNKEKIQKELFKNHLSQNYDDSELAQIDTSELWNAFRKDLAVADSSLLILHNDSTFHMRSYGLIISKVIPGWHFGDIVSGKWSRNEEILVLSAGDARESRQFIYKILKQTTNTLRIGEMVVVGAEPHLICDFVRK